MKFQKKSVLATSMLLVFNFTLMGCKGSDSKKTEQVGTDDVTGYSEASCLYKYHEGPMALSKSTADVRTSFFGKHFDLNLLRPVLGASGAEVVRFAETTGVRYYKTAAKVHAGSTSCGFLSELPQAPYDLDAKFKEVSGEKDSVLGLYWGLKSPGLSSTNSIGTITIRENANKWILVHEYMHHLFEIQAVAEGVNVSGLSASIVAKSNDYLVAYKALKDSNTSNRSALVKEAASKFAILNAEYLVLLRQYTLEEMTIESTLAEKLDSRELSFVLDKQRINGAAYIMQSAKKAAEQLSIYKDENERLRYTYYSEINASSEGSQLLELSKKMDSITSEMSSLSAKAKSFLNSKNVDYQPMHAIVSEVVTAEQHHTGCNHAQLPPEVIEEGLALQRNH